jgi:hypothetical protein
MAANTESLPSSEKDEQLVKHVEDKNGSELIINDQQSRRARLPFAHRATLCFYRIMTSLLLMMWIYLTPNTPSAFSCLVQGSGQSRMSLLGESIDLTSNLGTRANGNYMDQLAVKARLAPDGFTPTVSL